MRKLLRSLLLLACAAGVSAPALAQSPAQFPEKPIRFILGFAAGGPTDLSVRALAAAASRQLGQPMVVANMTGAGGTLAMAELARAPADGYLVAMHTSSYKAMTAHTQKLAFDLDEVRTLLGYAEFRHLLFVKADAPWGSIEDLIAYGRANPGAIKFGHVGPGTSLQLQGQLFFRSVGVQVTDVPYRGSSEFTNAVLGGHVNLAFIDIAGIRALARAGTVRLLVTITPQRFPEFPDVPTALEKGIQGPELFNPLVGVAIRKGTPPDRVKRLHDALRRATEDPEFVKALNDIGLKGGYIAPEAFDETVTRAEARAVPLLKELKLTAQ
jgi:tripartite-type tricarboxylate transporter receptor subunit TctC